MTTVDELRDVQGRARERMNRDNPQPLGPSEPREPPTFLCRDCGKPLGWDAEMSRRMAQWFDPQKPRFRCPGCEAARKEAEREAREQAAIRGPAAVARGVPGRLPGHAREADSDGPRVGT